MDFDLLEDIDVSSDQGEIEMIRTDVAALTRHYDDIAAQGGVDRATAQMLVRDCAVQLPEGTPVNSFTEVPSRTNLTITQEGIFSTIAHHVVDMIKKAAALLVRITRWIMEQLRKLLGMKKDSEKQVKAIGALHDVVNKHQNFAGTDVPGQASGHLATEFQRAVQDVSEAHGSYESNFNELIVDMLTGQKVSTLIRNVGMDLLSHHDAIEYKLGMFTDLLTGKLNGGDHVATAMLTKQLGEIIAPITVPRLVPQLGAAGVQVNTANLSDICEAIRSHCSQLRAARPSQVMTYEQAADRMAAHADEFVAPFIVHPEQWMRTLDALDRKLHALQNVPASAVISTEVSKLYMEANDVVGREITALRQFYIATVACQTARDQFANDLWEMFVCTTKMMKVKAAILGEDAELRKDLNAVGSQLRAA